MRPILFTVLGLDVPAYGVSKAVAALVAGALIARTFARAGIARDRGYALAVWAMVWGFLGAKAYYVLEHLPALTVHDLGGSGFTWYGGLLSGGAAVVVMARRWRLPVGFVAGAVAVPLSLAYAIGRVGCFLAGDGTYGSPTDLPWAVTFPHGVVSTTVRVHPAPLYEAAAAVLIAMLLTRLRTRAHGWALFGWYLLLSGVARWLVELVRTNEPVLAGMTQPQLWALVSTVVGVALIRRGGAGPDGAALAFPGDAQTTGRGCGAVSGRRQRLLGQRRRTLLGRPGRRPVADADTKGEVR